MTRLVIVGGGIAGLAAAWRAQALSAERPVEITLVEREDRLGGKIRTELSGGFLFEMGAESFLSRKPAGVKLCEELDLLDRLQGRTPRSGRSFVMHRHALHPLPEGLSGFIPTDLDSLKASSLLSEEAKRRFEREPTIPPDPGSGDQSVARFLSRRLGPEVFHLLVEPLVSGIYAGDAALLSVKATYPQLLDLERRYGSLLAGLKAQAAPAGGLPAFVSFPLGMAELVSRLAGRLTSVRIVLGAAARSVETAREGIRVELADGGSLEADAGILAVPAYEAARLLAGLDPELAALHERIPYASSAVVQLAFDSPAAAGPLDGYGYVVPSVEESDILACTWSSSKWEHRAPDGSALIRYYLGRFGRDDITRKSDRELVEAARSELAATLGIQAAPARSLVVRWDRAMPQYLVGHLDRLEAIEERLALHPGLYLAGAAYRGVGIPDCIASGWKAAELALGGGSR